MQRERETPGEGDAARGFAAFCESLHLKRGGGQSRTRPPIPTQQAPEHKFQDYPHPSEAEHRTAEEFYWHSSNQLSRAVAVATALTVIFAFGTFWEAKRQADSASDSDRAWMDVSLDEKKVSLVWNDGKPVMSGTVDGYNAGKSPALDVQLFGVLFLPTSSSPAADKAETRHRCQSDPGVGNMVFMQDKTISKEFQAEFSINVTSHGKPINDFPVVLAVAVCAVYWITGDTRVHHTARVYDVGKQESHPADDSLAAMRLNENLTASQIRLKREIDGEFAD